MPFINLQLSSRLSNPYILWLDDLTSGWSIMSACKIRRAYFSFDDYLAIICVRGQFLLFFQICVHQIVLFYILIGNILNFFNTGLALLIIK